MSSDKKEAESFYRCENCLFYCGKPGWKYHLSTDGGGWPVLTAAGPCKRYPPTVVMPEPKCGGFPLSTYPIVKAEDLCGEFKKR